CLHPMETSRRPENCPNDVVPSSLMTETAMQFAYISHPPCESPRPKRGCADQVRARRFEIARPLTRVAVTYREAHIPVGLLPSAGIPPVFPLYYQVGSRGLVANRAALIRRFAFRATARGRIGSAARRPNGSCAATRGEIAVRRGPAGAPPLSRQRDGQAWRRP